MTRSARETPALAEARAMLDRVRGVQLSPAQLEAQRRSFAYGNARIEDDTVTKEAVDQAAERLRRS